MTCLRPLRWWNWPAPPLSSCREIQRVQALCEAKNHGLVLKDAALERSALGIVNSSFDCAGMRCMALPVLCVEEAVADEFLSCLVKFARERKVGCAYHPETELGPVVSADHKKSVIDWILGNK